MKPVRSGFKSENKHHILIVLPTFLDGWISVFDVIKNTAQLEFI